MGFGDWSEIGVFDVSIPDGYRFTCETVHTDGFHDAGGVELAVVYQWVVADGSVVAAWSRGEFAEWDAFYGEFSAWLLETYPDDWWDVVFSSGVPTAESVPTVRQYLPLFLEESPDWPRPPGS